MSDKPTEKSTAPKVLATLTKTRDNKTVTLPCVELLTQRGEDAGTPYPGHDCSNLKAVLDFFGEAHVLSVFTANQRQADLNTFKHFAGHKDKVLADGKTKVEIFDVSPASGYNLKANIEALTKELPSVETLSDIQEAIDKLSAEHLAIVTKLVAIVTGQTQPTHANEAKDLGAKAKEIKSAIDAKQSAYAARKAASAAKRASASASATKVA